MISHYLTKATVNVMMIQVQVIHENGCTDDAVTRLWIERGDLFDQYRKHEQMTSTDEVARAIGVLRANSIKSGLGELINRE